MLNLSHVNIRINKDSVKWLKRKGVSIPEQADTVEHIFIPKKNEFPSFQKLNRIVII